MLFVKKLTFYKLDSCKNTASFQKYVCVIKCFSCKNPAFFTTVISCKKAAFLQKYNTVFSFNRDINMAKATSKTSWGTVLLMIFMVFWVLLATAAKGEAPSGRNEAKGKQINTKNSFNYFSMECRYLIDDMIDVCSRPMTKFYFNSVMILAKIVFYSVV